MNKIRIYGGIGFLGIGILFAMFNGFVGIIMGVLGVILLLYPLPSIQKEVENEDIEEELGEDVLFEQIKEWEDTAQRYIDLNPLENDEYLSEADITMINFARKQAIMNFLPFIED